MDVRFRRNIFSLTRCLLKMSVYNAGGTAAAEILSVQCVADKKYLSGNWKYYGKEQWPW